MKKKKNYQEFFFKLERKTYKSNLKKKKIQ